MTIQENQFRLLIVDDNESIHEDFRKILLARVVDSELADDEALLFGSAASDKTTFDVDSALQGREGLECVKRAKTEGRPYALAFVDVRMPPGWDGIETIEHFWKADPDLQIVICTAHSDYNWKDISNRLGPSDSLVILKKPFDIIEVTQLAHALTAKWTAMHQARIHLDDLNRMVKERTTQLTWANGQLRVLAAALESAANSVSITDQKGTIVWANAAFSKLSGYSAEQAIGTDRSILRSGEQNDEFYRNMWASISSGNTWRGEIVNRCKDGTLSPEEMTITPVVSPGDGITHFIAINQDISERKKAEKALREAEEKYRAIFEDAVVGIFQATPDGRLIDINRAFAAIHGYDSPEQMLAEGANSDNVVGLIRFAEIRGWLDKDGVIQGKELEVRCRDGSLKWVMANVRASRNAEGDVIIHEGTIEDITERKLAQQQVNYLAYYDALTGLPNRRLLHDRMQNATSAARGRGGIVGLLFLDLDRFKIINDSLGHSFGDLLLQCAANRLKGEIRHEDTVSRVGGDEFLIVLSHVADVAEIEAIAARVVNSLIGEFNIQGRSLGVSCSLGISIFPQHGEDVESLIRNADAAMYCAKERGSNTFCFFNEEMNQHAMERLNLESDLRTALVREEFFLEYQPQIDIATGTVTALEALIRWQHPHFGRVMPDEFIRVAEHSGLIIAIGDWVLKAVCSQLRRWIDDGVAAVPVAINVSAVQFRHEGFGEMVKQALRESRLAPGYLELELTESVLFSNADVTFSVLDELNRIGLKLVLDDFGTGYSSLSYLRQLPIAKLKIDRSFIREVVHNPDDASITSAIVRMAKSLHLKVIAEGVENEDQLSFLREHQCNEYQGYYYSHPGSALEAEAMLRTHSKAGPPKGTSQSLVHTR